MNILFLSWSGEISALAYRVAQEGINTSLWIRENNAKNTYNGLVYHVKRWENVLRSDTLVVFDSTGGGKTGERLRAEGYKVVGGSQFGDQLEFDMEVTQELLTQCDVPTTHDPQPPLFTVDAWFDGREFSPLLMYSLKRTRFCNGELGHRTQGMGLVRWFQTGTHGTFEQLKGILIYHRYKGPCALTFDKAGRVVDWVLRYTWDTWMHYPFFKYHLLGADELTFPLLQPELVVKVVQPGYGVTSNVGANLFVGKDPMDGYFTDIHRTSEGLMTTGFRGSVMSGGLNQAYASLLVDKTFRTDLLGAFLTDLGELKLGV